MPRVAESLDGVLFSSAFPDNEIASELLGTCTASATNGAASETGGVTAPAAALEGDAPVALAVDPVGEALFRFALSLAVVTAPCCGEVVVPGLAASSIAAGTTGKAATSVASANSTSAPSLTSLAGALFAAATYAFEPATGCGATVSWSNASSAFASVGPFALLLAAASDPRASLPNPTTVFVDEIRAGLEGREKDNADAAGAVARAVCALAVLLVPAPAVTVFPALPVAEDGSLCE